MFAWHEVRLLAERDLWLFCPFCGESLAELAECGPEYTREVHVASLPSSKAICLEDIVRVNCGLYIKMETHLDGEHKLDRHDKNLCQECAFQIPRISGMPFETISPYYHIQLRGKIRN